MNSDFGPQVVRLYALAARTLGWQPDEFWAATPAELVAALSPPAAATDQPIGRDQLNTMMELDNE